MTTHSGAVRAPQPPRRGSSVAALQAVRKLLDKLTAAVSGGQASDELPDVEAWPPQAVRSLKVIMGHIQLRPELIVECAPPQRDLLLRLMAAHLLSASEPPASEKATYRVTEMPAHRWKMAAPAPALWTIEDAIFPKAIDLLGGPRLLRHKPSTQAEIHAAVVDGIPYAVLFFLTTHATSLSEDDVAHVVGVSPRTLRRQKETPQKAMPADLGSKAWLLAETLAKAEDVFGGREEAERWMLEEAMGLDGARPIDMLRTLQGANLVNQFLERLKYGVYN